jgi:Sec-independent protein secretion pathway component TatC
MDNLPAASFPSRLVAARDTFVVAAVLAAVFTWTPDAFAFLSIFLPCWALLYAAFEVVRFLFGRERDGGDSKRDAAE